MLSRPGGGRRGSAELGRRGFLTGLVGLGSLATSGLAAAEHADYSCSGVVIEFLGCRLATVSSAHTLSALTIYYVDADGNRAVAEAVPPTTSATYGPLRVQYASRHRTTRVVATGAGTSIVRLIGERSGCRTAVTNPATRCVPAGFNAPPRATFDVSLDPPRAGQEFRLTASVDDPDLPADRLWLEWDLDGDGTTRTGTSIRHSYETTAPATAVLRVFDDFDEVATVQRTITPTPSSYRQVQAIAGDATFAGQRFGSVVAADATRLLAIGGNEVGSSAGTVYERSSGTWTEASRLRRRDGEPSGVYGSAGALDGATALVGASGNRDHGDNAGAAYVFSRSGTGEWTQSATLTAADADEYARFGFAAALEGGTALVGAQRNRLTARDPGGVYVFERDGDGWTQTAKLVPPGLGEFAGTVTSVALAGDLALVGAPDSSMGPGAAHVYRRTGGGWDLETTLGPADLGYGDHFGYDVALDGDEALVSAPWQGYYRSADQRGAAYHFVRASDGTWREASKLTAVDGPSAGGFGMSVDLADDIALVGAPNDDHAGRMSGSAYLFARTPTGWTQDANLVASDAAPDERLGWAVAVAGTTAVAGAPWSDRAGWHTGAVMAFEPR